jgi:hypothetical protein
MNWMMLVVQYFAVIDHVAFTILVHIVERGHLVGLYKHAELASEDGGGGREEAEELGR